MHTSRGALAAALADRYTIGRELGRGGMGSVYVAEDLRHDRQVAIKVLHAEVASAIGIDRFQREIHLAARLQHPHILTVHDSGEAAGCLWFTMPLVEGESLRDRLKRDGRLSVDETVRLTTEVADALGYAHERQVLHRDIKPENILLSNGHAIVADFGIARRFGDSVTNEGLTGTGVAIGTPAYMSPEQASGDVKVDGRTDVYSLGCVLYEMLGGVPPFTGPNAQAIVAAVLTTAPRPLSEIRPELPRGLVEIVERATAREIDDRYPTAAALARDLGQRRATAWRPRRWPRGTVRAAVGVAGVFAALGVSRLLWTPATAATPSVSYVAVLPFQADRASDAYLASGLTDQVRGKLAGLKELAIIASTSSDRYRGSTQAPETIAADLGADYLLTGRYRWNTDPARAAVEVELLRVLRGGRATIVWDSTVSVAPNVWTAVPNQLAGGVVGALGISLDAQAREALAVRPTRDSIAWDEYIRGSEGDVYVSTSYGENQTLAKHFRRAVDRDSLFGEAWARLAITQVGFGDSTVEKSIQHALSLMPEHPETALAVALYEERHGDYSRAQVVGARALRAHPNDVRALAALARVEVALGRFDEAERYFRRAERLDPRSAFIQNQLTSTYLYLRRPADALLHARRAVEFDSLSPVNHLLVATSCLALGDLQCARNVVRTVPGQIGAATLFATMSLNEGIVPWILDRPDLQLLVKFGQSAWGDSRADWAFALSQAYDMLGDSARGTAYADTALDASQHSGLTTLPDYRCWQAGIFARAGLRDSAVTAIRQGTLAMPVEKNARIGAYVLYLSAIAYAKLGMTDSAFVALDRLFSVPFEVTPGWLRVDPDFASLRGDARFQALIQRSTPKSG